MRSSLIVRVTLDMSSIILTAAALGFLGMGVQPPSPEWGAMIATARRFILEQWWVPTIPGLAIFLASLAFNLLGDGLRDVLDPKQRQGFGPDDSAIKECMMIYELRTYELKLGRTADYLAIFEAKGFPVLSRYATPIGFWFSGPTETGLLDRVNHIWGYDSVAARIERRAALYRDPAWINELVPAVMETFVRLRGQLMTLQPGMADRLDAALTAKQAKGPVVASMGNRAFHLVAGGSDAGPPSPELSDGSSRWIT